MFVKRKTSFLVSLLLVLFLLVIATGCSNHQADSNFTPGIYEGVGQGHNGEITVEVEVDSEEILSIEVIDHKESEGISDTAIEKIPEAVLEGQTLAVDVIAGVTKTSEGLLEAISTALEEAGGNIENLQ